MIDFDRLASEEAAFKQQFLSNSPFPHLVIDDFAHETQLLAVLDDIPDPLSSGINKSRDYVFAKNKFEKSAIEALSPGLGELKADLLSEPFQRFLQSVTGEDVFIDPQFHGGGVHQGGAGSFLDMHADFNLHPENPEWFRNLNILLYLNKGWKPEWGGSLKLRHRQTGEAAEVEPLFNRCVIMFTRDYTLHGYDAISFPDGQFRRSIAAYAYSRVNEEEESLRARSTTWYPEKANPLKKLLGRSWPILVKVKNRLFGSSTSKNR